MENAPAGNGSGGGKHLLGTYHPVLDHGRIVENTYYGRVFYVMIMDCALLETHYDR